MMNGDRQPQGAEMSAKSVLVLLLLPVTGYAADYRLPCKGTWFVMQGGDTINVNHHMRVPSQWFGVDLLKAGGVNGRHLTRGSGRTVKDFYSWGQPVLSPVAGTVETVRDGEPDHDLGKTDKKKPFGNFVCIRVSDSEFVYLAHFQKGSLKVKAGDKVKAGQLLSKCGNSGNTTSPHIHMHVQSSAKLYAGRGKNITFKGIDVLLSGKTFKRVNWPLIRGLFVSNSEAAEEKPKTP